MHREEHTYFDMLKMDVVAAMRQSYPGISPDISQWKGQEITDFQEDLLMKARGQVSEKWFYSHLKADNESLPRIDVLNLLSRYAGYANWDDFRFKKAGLLQRRKALRKSNLLFIIVPFTALAILLLLYGFYQLFSTRTYTFCFYDSDTREPILQQSIEVTILSDEESPVNHLCDSTGCFSLRTDRSVVEMVVKTPYYQQDTIKRILRKFNSDEEIGLHVNHYAMMIRYFSGMMVDDWQKRRDQLDRMFDDGAVIYQVRGGRRDPGMILYNKQEFIDRLTMPADALRHIEVLETRYFKERIMLLKFRIKTQVP